MKRPLLLVCVSLLTMGGLYYGLFQRDSEKEFIDRKSGVAVNSDRSAMGLDVTRPSPDGKTIGKTRPTSVAKDSEDKSRAEILTPHREQPPQDATPVVQSNRDERNPLLLADATTGHVTDAETQQFLPPLGIRLAPDVRLPVAAMPNNDLKLNPIKQKALQDIVDEYYRTVAAVSAQESGGQSGTTVVEENGEQTRVITNSPAVNSARMRADLRFKAIFGHAAYNRMSINTLLESRLPQPTPDQ